MAYDYADRAVAPATLRAYAADWRVFVAWCEPRGLCPIPALPETVAVHIADEAKRGRKPSTIGRRLAAIRAAHTAVQLEPPTTAAVVRRVVHGIRREHGTRADKKSPATVERLVAMTAHCPTTLTGKRDRALLLLGFAGAFRRSELVALDVADLEEAADGLRVLVRRGKTDQEGEGAVVAIVRGRDACPVAAVRAWLAAAGITEGAVFRPVSKGGRVLDGRLAPFSVARIVKHYAERAGLDPDAFAGHSLRAGFLTSAAERGKPLDRLMAVSRHRRVDTLLGYIRRADDFRDHAGAGLL
ncbi:site-specific integrase [Roseisolibacter sp. H3M3-2]|uniref:site-specific integrase n=1 Tax=Roseisolibacter sp. H3M3-2 TaxID=3031323 RepID=UPI0023DA5311|nr:site-specific integrase [Roseisolibacter sp. H3M3-2]MDF1502299.1 site-specific integrase [Roseisolibacter sp. H3M3-2]